MKKILAEIAVEWKSEKCRYVKESTMSTYNLIVDNHILKEFGEKSIVNMKNSDIQMFIDKKIAKWII